MNIKHTLIATALFASFSASTQAGMVVDGDLKDWLAAPTGTSSDWIPTDPATKYFIEDQSGLEANGYLSPGYGGQAYDAEAIYLKKDTNFLYVAVVTGLSPATIDFPAGDLAFDFGNDGTYDYGVVVKSDSQYSGNLYSAQNGGIGSQGEIYAVDKWNVGLWDKNGAYVGYNNGTSAHPTSINSGTTIGNAEVAYTEALYNGSTLLTQLGNFSGKHYVIEAKIPLLVFAATDLAKAFTVHWAMGCANDAIAVDPEAPLAATVPVPATLGLLVIGLTLLSRYRNPLTA